jgi:rubredoxin
MKQQVTIKINFRGGIISPGDLYNILVAASRAGIRNVSFGLRQQLFISCDRDCLPVLLPELEMLGIKYETGLDNYPNIVSSYPAEEVFITNTWLSEGVYKDIFDGMDYQPRLKINVSDSNQSFTPLLTGNINWVASSTTPHFWNLFIRFPKTNIIYEWNEMIYTNDIPKLSRDIESIIFTDKKIFIDNDHVTGDQLFRMINLQQYITRRSEKPAVLPSFNLPYYEGLNRYNNNKYWLGIYRRDELFDISFLKELCLVCLDTKVGQLCSTPWKSIIIKGIDEKDKLKWNLLLEKFQVNMRHAANELNFQVEDDCQPGLQLKSFLVKQLNDNDTRSFGICIGIKTRKKSEVFSSILVRRKSLLNIFGLKMFHVYDILCAYDFNPNERTGFVFSRNNPKFLLGEQLRRSLVLFYKSRADKQIAQRKAPVTEALKKPAIQFVYQCIHCFGVYEEVHGDEAAGIAAGTSFNSLPDNYTCSLCEAPKEDFVKINRSKLGLQPV